MVLSGEEDDGCNNVQIIWNEFTIEAGKSKEGVDSLDQGWGVPVSDGCKFGRIHADKTLSNNHSQVLHGGGVEGAFGDLEGEALFLEVREDSTGL